MNILVSACLLGVNCRYSAVPAGVPELKLLMDKNTLIPVCPEQLGGLPTPRAPSERQGENVISKTGENVTAQYRRGAEETLRLARLFDCKYAILKERSPSCGSGEIYDGSFSRTLMSGDGVTAELLKANSITVLGETRIFELLENETLLN